MKDSRRSEKKPTVRDVKVAEEKLIDFRNRMRLVEIDCANIGPSTDVLESFSERSDQQNKLGQKGNDLLRAIKEQIIEDHSGLLESVTYETKLSAEARKKFQRLLKFLDVNRA